MSINDLFKKYEKIFNAATPRILHIGTAPNKNLERVVPALNGINCNLVIIGKINQNIVSLLEQNKVNYELFDRRLTENEVVEEYNKCDILTFVSTLEGFGMPIVEANTVGRVVITGNVTSMPEIAGDAACLVDPFDVEAISKGFKKIIADKGYRERLIENGFKNAQRFSLKTLADEYASIYRSL